MDAVTDYMVSKKYKMIDEVDTNDVLYEDTL